MKTWVNQAFETAGDLLSQLPDDVSEFVSISIRHSHEVVIIGFLSPDRSQWNSSAGTIGVTADGYIHRSPGENESSAIRSLQTYTDGVPAEVLAEIAERVREMTT